jgi:hypothetical protein
LTREEDRRRSDAIESEIPDLELLYGRFVALAEHKESALLAALQSGDQWTYRLEAEQAAFDQVAGEVAVRSPGSWRPSLVS